VATHVLIVNLFVLGCSAGVCFSTASLLRRFRALTADAAKLAEKIGTEAERAGYVLRQLDARLGFAQRKIREGGE